MEKNKYIRQGFTLSIEELPGMIDVKMLTIKKGKTSVSICLLDEESSQLVKAFEIPVQPPAIEVF